MDWDMEKTGAGKRVWDFLGSRDLSVFIFVAACTYSLILVIFATVVPVPWVNRISSLLPFKFLYLLFFVNLIICEIKWIPVIVRRCRKQKPPYTAEELQRFRHRVEVRSQETGVRGLEKYLRRRGYKVQELGVRSQNTEGDSPIHRFTGSTLLYAHRGRFSPVGNLLFHAAFLFIIAGVFVGFSSWFDRSAILVEGEDFSADEVGVNFRVEKVDPAYWKDRLHFTDLKATVRYPEKGVVRTGVVRLSQPLRIGGGKVSMAGIGFVPMYRLRDKDGVELDSGYVRLNVFPPGNEDHFKIPGYPHQIFVSFYPDYLVEDGNIRTRSMNPVNPAYSIKVFRNKVPSYGGIIRPGEEAYFEGLRLSFPDFKYWGMFRVVHNGGHPFIWIAFVMFVSGLAWRLLFYRREVVLVREGETLYLFGNSEYYPRLFEERLNRIAEG